MQKGRPDRDAILGIERNKIILAALELNYFRSLKIGFEMHH